MGLLGNLFGKHRRLVFDAPAGWDSEEAEGGTLILAPHEEAGWQANIFVEEVKDRESRDLKAMLNDLVPNLKHAKKGVEILGSTVERHASGFEYGVLRYRVAGDGVALRERQLVVPLGGRHAAMVLFSAADSIAAKYERVFDDFVGSLMIE